MVVRFVCPIDTHTTARNLYQKRLKKSPGLTNRARRARGDQSRRRRVGYNDLLHRHLRSLAAPLVKSHHPANPGIRVLTPLEEAPLGEEEAPTGATARKRHGTRETPCGYSSHADQNPQGAKKSYHTRNYKPWLKICSTKREVASLFTNISYDAYMRYRQSTYVNVFRYSTSSQMYSTTYYDRASSRDRHSPVWTRAKRTSNSHQLLPQPDNGYARRTIYFLNRRRAIKRSITLNQRRHVQKTWKR